ncbi:MAG: 23S rRNA (guanosine(2251)-2'-O)-methyltransferase RlmB [Erysipelotrichaceae bacterium]|jgi:23S rRNA (guanosine2251-2'-O)-methyltransferase|nr:23S rRNA (guanosine(2251)-2'-O)-methyltransferase RlmB [Erysipelotrichaceae bacterium]
MAQYIYGKHAIKEHLLKKQPVQALLLADGLKDQEIVKLAKEQGILVEYVSRTRLDQLIKGVHQGMAALVAEIPLLTLDELLSKQPEDTDGLLVLLDGIEDPRNLGAILRVADGAGANGVIIPKHRASPLTPEAIKSAAGAAESVPVATVTNLTQAIQSLKDKGYWVVGASGEGSEDYRSFDVKRPLVVVIGNEGKGISRLVAKQCDWLVSLPMRGQVSSLNASVACGILLYSILDRRFPLAGGKWNEVSRKQ